MAGRLPTLLKAWRRPRNASATKNIKRFKSCVLISRATRKDAVNVDTFLDSIHFCKMSLLRREWVDGKVHETGFTTVYSPNTMVPYTDAAGTIYDVDFVSATESNSGDT